MNHERIHLKQQAEMLLFPFYIWYLVAFFWHLTRKKSFRKAYEEISFEKEAFRNATNEDYLKTRPFWAFLSYIGK